MEPVQALTLRHRLSNAWAGLVSSYEQVKYDLGLWKDPNGAIPHAVKRRVVRDYAKRFALRTLVETGTHVGHMVAAMLKHFDEIYSIEFGPVLYERARARFAGKRNVHLYLGDSASTLPVVVAALRGPALFWLDAHYSGGPTARGSVETPIVAELQRVLGAGGARHVILIDDARLFQGTHDYPTLEELRRLVGVLRSDYEMTVTDDVIRLVPSGPA